MNLAGTLSEPMAADDTVVVLKTAVPSDVSAGQWLVIDGDYMRILAIDETRRVLIVERRR